MTVSANQPSRRAFVTGAVAAAGGLSLGFHVPFAPEAAAQGAAPALTRRSMPGW